MNNHIEENLLKVEADENKIMAECEEKKQEKESLEEHIRFLNEQCKSQETGKQELEHNLDLMNKQESVQELEEKLSKYKAQLNELKYEQRKKEYVELQNKRDSLEKEVLL